MKLLLGGIFFLSAISAAGGCPSSSTDLKPQVGVLQTLSTACKGTCGDSSGSDSKDFGPYSYKLSVWNMGNPDELKKMRSEIQNYVKQKHCPDGCQEAVSTNTLNISTEPKEKNAEGCKIANQPILVKNSGGEQTAPKSDDYVEKNCDEANKKCEAWVKDFAMHNNSQGTQVGEIADPANCSLKSNYITSIVPIDKKCKCSVELQGFYVPRKKSNDFVSKANVRTSWTCSGDIK